MPYTRQLLPNIIKIPCAFALCKPSYHYPYSNDSKKYAVVVVFFHNLNFLSIVNLFVRSVYAPFIKQIVHDGF